MSVQGEIDRIKKNVNDTLKAIGDTGVTVGAGSDALPAAARALANEKQNKLTGMAGQFVGFDKNGNAIPQNAPQSGMTQTQADERYLQLSGGTVTGDFTIMGPFTAHSLIPLQYSTQGLHLMSIQNTLNPLSIKNMLIVKNQKPTKLP